MDATLKVLFLFSDCEESPVVWKHLRENGPCQFTVVPLNSIISFWFRRILPILCPVVTTMAQHTLKACGGGVGVISDHYSFTVEYSHR